MRGAARSLARALCLCSRGPRQRRQRRRTPRPPRVRAGRSCPSPTRPRAGHATRHERAVGRPPTRERRGRRRSRPARPGASETVAVGEDVSFPRWVEPVVLRDVDGSVRRARTLSFPEFGWKSPVGRCLLGRAEWDLGADVASDGRRQPSPSQICVVE